MTTNAVSCHTSQHSPHPHFTRALHTRILLETRTAHGTNTGLVLLDLSAAFDMVDHDILIRRLQTSYGLSGSVLLWVRSYLVPWYQSVRTGSTLSSPTLIVCGVPQGSVLGPILFFVVHRRPNSVNPGSRSSPTSICRRHPDL